MQKILIVAVVVLVCLPVLLSAARGGNRPPKVNRQGGESEEEAPRSGRKNCGKWVSGQCVPKNNAACGEGTLTKTRTGDNCPQKQRSAKCHVKCNNSTAPPASDGATARPAGGRKAKVPKCKYAKGDWSSCDAATNTKTRTLTLKARRNAPASTECEQTKVESRKCASGRNNRENNRRTGN